MKTNKFPPGWDEQRVREVLDYYEHQTDEEASTEHEAVLDSATATPLLGQQNRKGTTTTAMSYSTLTRKGQVTIPKPLRDRLGLLLGDRISFHLRGEEIVLKPVHRTILDVEGSVQPKSRPENFATVRRQVAAVRGRSRSE